MSDDNFNPFLYMRVGMSVGNSHGELQYTIRQDASITEVIPVPEIKKSMSGQSAYVCGDQMNQGTLSIAGAYGVTGIEKVEAGGLGL